MVLLPREAYAVMRCLSVCASVTFVSCFKTNKDIFEIFSPSASQAILVFPCQTGWRYSDGNPLTGVSNTGGVGKKRDPIRISGFAAYRSTVLSTVRVAKCEKQICDERQQASSRALAAASVVRCSHNTTTKSLWRARRYILETEVKPPGHNPLGHNPVFCCRRTS